MSDQNTTLAHTLGEQIMKTVRNVLAVVAVTTGFAGAQENMVLHIEASQTTLMPGESVDYTIWAELLNPAAPILATVEHIEFDLTFGGTTLTISDNVFFPAFDNDFFGPSIPGMIIGDSIVGAFGVNPIPPIADPGGPDSSNPLFIYAFTLSNPSNATGSFTPQISINGEFAGAYVGAPFPVGFLYQISLNRGPHIVPFSIAADTVTFIPAPATGAIALLGLIATRRRSR